MKKAYIILAHKYPDQLARLVSRLNDGASEFFIHIDKKSTIDFTALHHFGSAVYFVQRVESCWASFAIVEATLQAMKVVRQSGKNFERIILLSGQDYPIKSNKEIDNFFRTSPHSVFLDFFPIPNYKKWPGGDRGGWYRVDKYFIGLKKYELFCSRSLNLAATCLPFLRRRQPKNMKPFTGSQWWILDRYALEYILDYVAQNPRYTAFHKYTFAPDELFFHMLLVNSNDERIKKSITNDNKRFMLWQVSDSAHPNTLTIADWAAIQASDALFARKFDATVDEDILNLIDSQILQYKMPAHHSNNVLTAS